MNSFPCCGLPSFSGYAPDFLVFDEVIVEIKAVETLADAHLAQTANKLTATGKHVGLLVNFGAHPKLEARRLVCGVGPLGAWEQGEPNA